MVLLLEDHPGRRNLKEYFYSDRPWLTLMFWAGILLIPLGGIGGILLLIWATLKVYFMVAGSKGDERLYDEILAQDVEYLKQRSVETLGVIEDEYSLIEPVIGTSFAPESDVQMGAELTADKKNIFKMFYEALVSIPRAVIRFIRRLLGKDDYLSKAIFYEGNDNIVRGSLVNVTTILFTEQQILSYSCSFDIALGLILKENVREVFYRDVDSVNYGDATAHIVRADGSFIRTPLTRLRLAVSSGSDVVADILGDSDLLENQIMAMKSLIRSKKESLA